MIQITINQWLGKQSLYQAIKLLVEHLKWHEFVLGVLLSSLFINVSGLVFPLMLLQFYDRIIPFKSLGTLHVLVFICIIAVILEMILKSLRTMVTLWSTARYEHVFGLKIFKNICKLTGRQQTLSAGSIANRLSAFFSVKDFYGGQSVSLLVDIPFVFIYLSLIFYIGGSLVLVPITLFVVFLAFADHLGNILQKDLAEKKQLDEQRTSFIMEMLSGIRTVKGFTMESFMKRRHERLQDSTAELEYKISNVGLNSTILSSYSTQITTVAVVTMGAFRIMGGELTIGSLAACSLLSNRTLVPLAQAMMFWKRLQNTLITEKTLQDLVVIDEKEQGEDSELLSAAKIKGDIKLNNIDLYFKEEQKLFSNTSLHVQPREFICIDGEGSSGKSLLLKIMAGVYEANNGEVLIDGIPIKHYDPETLHKKMAYLPQAGVLFKGTILENISMFDSANIETALRWANRLQLYRNINRLPDGYETEVGVTLGQMLPSGMIQQIVAVQNLIYNPKILLFDEANNSVDMTTDKLFISLLEHLKGKMTIVAVSRRPSLMKLADKIYQIEEGKICLRRAYG